MDRTVGGVDSVVGTVTEVYAPATEQAGPVHLLPAFAAVRAPLTTALQLAPLGGFALDISVPQAVVAPLRRALGIDVSGFPVRRGGAVTRAAHRLGARGFTADGVVHIPDHAGALDSREAAPLLAHELTHAAQQRRFGSALPSPGSAPARELEDEAVAVEEWVGSGAVGPPPLVVRQLAPADRRRPPGPFDDWEGAHDLPVLDAAELVREAGKATGAPIPALSDDHRLPDVSVDGLMAAYHDLRRLAEEEDEEEGDEEEGDDGGRVGGRGGGRGGRGTTGGGGDGSTSETDVDHLMELIADNPPRRWLDLDSPDDFEEIANRLYNHLIGRLRFDVLVERERSGTLLDFS
jgi:hypothetical protein